MNTEQQSAFEGWAIVELLGRHVLAGYVTEQSMAGAGFFRVDVPGTEFQAAFTKFVGGGSIYGITPTTEEVVIKAAKKLAVRPVSQWVVPDAQPERMLVDSWGEYDAELDDDDEYDAELDDDDEYDSDHA